VIWGIGVCEEREGFFFEEKKQKTFDSLAA